MRTVSRQKPPLGAAHLNRSHPFAKGLVARWLFNEGAGTTLYDVAGVNHGALTNGPVWVPGRTGPSLKFDASNDFVNVGSDPALAITGNLTIATWIKRPTQSAAPNQHSILLGAYSSTSPFTGYGFAVGATDGGLGKANFWSNVQGSWVAANTRVDDNVWHHIAVSLSGSTAAFYKDGIADGSPTSAAPGSFTGAKYIGTVDGGTGTSVTWDGLIDDVRLYNRALSSTEIAQIYADSYADMAPVVRRRYQLPAGGLSIPVAMHHYRNRRIAA